MTSLGPSDGLPGNLSDQQLFVLAYLASITEPGKKQRWGTSFTSLSWATAEEFDDNGTSRNIWERGYGPEGPGQGRKREVLSPTHTASFTRTMERLDERGYLKRTDWHGKSTSNRRSIRVFVTNKGYHAGQKAIRRHQDGRYSLSFDTLDLDADD